MQLRQNLLILILLATTGFSSLFAQQVQLSGKVQDSLQNPLVYVNMIATPLSAAEKKITFAITNGNGRYELKLNKNTSYRLAITHLGYSQLIDTVQFTQDTHKNFTLNESSQTLEEVIIEAKMAMIVKEDTITYRADKFTTGEEHKLRGILKNLPGVEVDRDGNVSVNGKKVTTLLVEGEKFFTGDEKLGVNNIPADAVEEVVVIDDYHNVAFLKGLTDSDKMVLNIKLKKGKKKFVFGDIEVGVGVKERYLINPTLFYYSPKTAVNFIGDINNIGEKSFSLEDYLNFEGGFTNFDELFSLYDSDFAQFLGNTDFTFQKNEFGALSVSQEIGEYIRINAYSINSYTKTHSKTSWDNDYLTQANLDEQRLKMENNRSFFSLNKLELHYTPNFQTDLKYKTIIKTSNRDASKFIRSRSTQDSTKINSSFRPRSLKIGQHLTFNKQFSYKHTSRLNLSYTYQKDENAKKWLFDQAIFSNIIPFIDEGNNFNLLQNMSKQSHAFNFRLKHFWVLNNFNHLYPVIGLRYHDVAYGTLDYQLLKDGSINSFQNSGFNNQLDFRLMDNYVGFEYKRKLGNFILKPGLVYHYFKWNIKQFGAQITFHEKWVLLPKLKAEYDWSTGQNLDFEYRLRTKFAGASQYANRLRLTGFNSLYRGNKSLENELYHEFSLFFLKSNLFKGNLFSARFQYTHRLQKVQTATVLRGIDQIRTAVFTSTPQNSYRGNASFTKMFGDIKFHLGGRFSLSEYSQIINHETQQYHSENYTYRFSTETRFENLPKLYIRYPS